MQHTRSTIIESCRLCGADTPLWTTATLRVRRGSIAEMDGGRQRERRYMRCPVCDQIQCYSVDLPSHEEERERYDEHNNTLTDPRYRKYLEGFIDAGVTPFLPGHIEPDKPPTPGLRILDFGSGPEPALAYLLNRRGYTTSVYDPFYAPDTAPLASPEFYDAITAVEVVEHLHQPAAELERLTALLKDNAVLAIRTGLFFGDVDDTNGFANWWYRRDISHVSFWTGKTVQWVCAQYGLVLIDQSPGDVLVFRRVRATG